MTTEFYVIASPIPSQGQWLNPVEPQFLSATQNVEDLQTLPEDFSLPPEETQAQFCEWSTVSFTSSSTSFYLEGLSDSGGFYLRPVGDDTGFYLQIVDKD